MNFKYERLSTFYFVCGVIGHSDQNCGIVYANPDKNITRAYGVWLRAQKKNSNSQNLGAKWLRSGVEGSQTWGMREMKTHQGATVPGGEMVEARFMEVDGRISEIPGYNGGLTVVQRDQSNNSNNNNFPK